MGLFDRFITTEGVRPAWFRAPTQATTAAWRLPAVLVLSLVALAIQVLGAPGSLGVVLVGAFMLMAPGLLLVELVRVGDGLLALVLAMMAGPVLWVVLPTVELFVGAWHPQATVGVVGVLLTVVSAVLLVRRNRAPVSPTSVPRLRMPAPVAAPAATEPAATTTLDPNPAPRTRRTRP